MDGLSEEILNSLTQISDLLVTGRTSSFTFKGSNKKTPEIANELGVENILEGSVRKAGNDLRITAQLLRGADGFHLWSKIHNRELKDIFAVQEDIATAVADELKITLRVGKSIKQLGATNNVKAYEHYMVAQGKYARMEPFSHIITSLDTALELDPEFSLAWATKAIRYIQSSNQVSANRVAAELAAGLSAAQKALELEPNIAEAYAALGFYNWTRGDFIEAELAIRKSLGFKSELMWGIGSSFANYYFAVGHFEKAYEIIDATLQNDPLNLPIRGYLIIYSNLVVDTKRAEEVYEGIRALVPDNWLFNLHITIIRFGSKEPVSRDKIPEILQFDPIWSFARNHLESREDALLELQRFYSNEVNLSSVTCRAIMIWASYFGDPKFALDVMEKAYNSEALSLVFVWAPVMREVRQLPRFKEFVKEIGLVDYWNKFGWPDFCHQLDNGDLEFD